MERPTAHEIGQHKEVLQEMLERMESEKRTAEAYVKFEVNSTLAEFSEWVRTVKKSIEFLDEWLKER